jgi:hypothetical protein
MATAQAQRTLVKSPPELWSELSDPASLARHLGALGEIRIVRTNPERSVEWEAREVKGTVEIKGSAWGTRVTLSATIDEMTPGSPDVLPEPMPTSDPEPAPATSGAPAAPPGAADESLEPRQPASVEQAEMAETAEVAEVAEVAAAVEQAEAVETTTERGAAAGHPPTSTDGTPATDDPAPPRRGVRAVLATLGSRIRRTFSAGRAGPPADACNAPATDADEAPAADASGAPPQATAAGNGRAADALRPAAARESVVAARSVEATTEVLAAVLDRLGEAHHRPFSRA